MRVSWRILSRSRAQQGLDGAAFVHRAVALGGPDQRQLEVEHLARIDLLADDEVDQFGQEAAHRGGAAVQVDAGEEQLLAGQLHVVGDTDVANVPARRADRTGNCWASRCSKSKPACCYATRRPRTDQMIQGR